MYQNRKGVSCSDGKGLLLTVGGVAEADKDVCLCQVGKVGEDFGLGHPGGEVGKNIVNGDVHPSDAGFAAALTGFKGDGVLVIYGLQQGFFTRDSILIAVEKALAQPFSSIAC